MICKVPIFAPTNPHMKRLLLLFLTLVLAGPALAQTNKALLNLDRQGVAVQGYDPVAFFVNHKPVKGTPGIQSNDHDAIYRFATPEDKALFDANPAHYEPAFGGYCAYGVSKGHLASVKVEAFQIIKGRLLMQNNQRVRDSFNENQTANLAKADATWPELAGKNGK